MELFHIENIYQNVSRETLLVVSCQLSVVWNQATNNQQLPTVSVQEITLWV